MTIKDHTQLQATSANYSPPGPMRPMKQTRGAVRTRAAPVRLHAPELAAEETMLAQANIVTTIVPTRVVVESIGIVMLGLDTFSEEPAQQPLPRK